MFGYATDESPEMMPLPILLAHKLTKGLTDDRKQGKVSFLRPDSKSQVSVLYENNEPKEVTAVVISTQHTPDANQKQITEYVREQLGPRMTCARSRARPTSTARPCAWRPTCWRSRC